jgi:hypothetical protein
MKSSKRLNLLINFLKPTLSGVTFYLIIYSCIVYQRVLSSYQNVFGGLRTSDFYGTWYYSVAHHINLFLALDTVGKTILFCLWLVFGTVVYLIVHYLATNVKGLSSEISEAEGHYVTPSGVKTNEALVQSVERLVIRITSFIATIFYIGLMAHVYVLWLKTPNRTKSLSPALIYEALVVFVATFGSLYVFTLLIRLLLLKNRIFNS